MLLPGVTICFSQVALKLVSVFTGMSLAWKDYTRTARNSPFRPRDPRDPRDSRGPFLGGLLPHQLSCFPPN